MKTDLRPASSGYGRASATSAGQQGDTSSPARQQRVSSASRAGSSTYFDIANTILGSAGDLDDLLLSAARDGDYNKVEQLLVKRSDIIVDIDCKDKRTGNTALIWAAKKGHNKIVQLLLRYGADPTLRNYNAKTAVEEATGATLTILLDSVSKATESSHRLLLQAAWQGNLEVIRRLLSNKVLDINCQNSEGLTPLMLVARDVQLFERLSRDLNTPYNPVEVAQELMKARADVHARDNDGRSCLHYASQSMATVADRLVQAFLGGGSEPAQLDKRQYMPIHWASQHGNTNVVMALLDGGSEVNCRGFIGLTPLHISAHNDNQCTALTLLQHGADVTLTDDRGLTPVDLAKTRKLKTILKEAWTEATQSSNAPELAPVRTTPSREAGSRLSVREESPARRRGEVIFDGMPTNMFGAQRGTQAGRGGANRSVLGTADRSRRTERQMMQEIENGRYTPSMLHGRENTRLLGTVRNKPGPPVLPHISRGIPLPGGTGRQSPPESPPPTRRSSQGEELRRSLEDGRNVLSHRSNAKRAPLPMRGRMSKTTPLSTLDRNEQGEESNTNSRRTHRRTGSDPFATRITDVASTLENIISNRRGETGKPDIHAMAASQHISPLRTPLERDVGISIPTTIPEANSPNSSMTSANFDTDHTNTTHYIPHHTQMMSLPPTSSRILPPTPTFLTQRSYSNLESVLARAAGKDDDSSSSKEPSPRSDDEILDNKLRVGLANPMELLRSRSLLKEEFILAESRPSDPFLVSSGSDPTSSSSSLSTASSSPREAAAGLGRTAYRRSDPSLLSLTLREKAMKGSGFRKSDPVVVRRSEKIGGGIGEKSSSEVNVSEDKPSLGNRSSAASREEGPRKVARSQSLRMTHRPAQQLLEISDPTNSGDLRRSQSIGSGIPETCGKQTAMKDSSASVQILEAAKGAPFSGKCRMVIVRDTFSEFDSVFTGNCTDVAQRHPPSSSCSVQSSAKKSSEAKPESTYVKEDTVMTERSRHSSDNDTARMSVSDVAISGVNQSDDTGDDQYLPTTSSSQQAAHKQSVNTCVSKPPVPNSQSPQNSNTSAGQKTVTSQPPSQKSVAGSSSANSNTKLGMIPSPSLSASSRQTDSFKSCPSSGKNTPQISGKGSASVKPSPTSSAHSSACNVKSSLTPSAHSSASSKSAVANSPVSSASTTVKSNLITSGNSSASSKSPLTQPASLSASSTSSPSPGSKPSSTATDRQQSSKEKMVTTAVSVNLKQGESSPSSSAIPASRTGSSSGIPSTSKPTVSKTGPAMSSSSPIVRSGSQSSVRRPSPSEQSPTMRKSASTDSLSEGRGGSSTPGRQVSGEAGKRQNSLSSAHRSLSSSAKDITARLSGSRSNSSRASSNSSLSNPRSDVNSSANSNTNSAGKATGASRPGTNAVSRSVSKDVLPQSAQVSVSKPVTSSTAGPSVSMSKPVPSVSAATPSAVAKVMQNLAKAVASPRPAGAASSPARPAESGSGQHSVVRASGKSVPASSTSALCVQGTVSSKPTVMSAATTAKQGKAVNSKSNEAAKVVTASQTSSSKSSPNQSSSAAVSRSPMDQKSSTDSKSGRVSAFGRSSLTPRQMKSPASEVLLPQKLDTDDGKEQAGEGIEPLVKITYGGMSPKPGAVISRYSDPASLNNTGPVIEDLFPQPPSRDKSPGGVVSASEGACIAGKTDKDTSGKKRPPLSAKGKATKGAKKGKDSKRPTSSSSRQASAGKRRGSKCKDSKAGDTEDARPKSGKRVRSGKRRGKKAAEKEADKEAALLSEMASKGDVALISGIGWHMATSCADTSDVVAAAEFHMDSSESDISDVESIEDAETLMAKLDVSRYNTPLTSPRFREIKSQADSDGAIAAIPALISDGFPPMNLDVTQRDVSNLAVQSKLQYIIAHMNDGDAANQLITDHEDNDEMQREILLRKLTPIPEMPSLSGPVGNVAEAIARFDRSLKDYQLNELLDGTPRHDSEPKSQDLEPSQASRNSARKEKAESKETSEKLTEEATNDKKGATNDGKSVGKPPRVEVTKVSGSSKGNRNAAKRSQSMKEESTKKEKPKRERKFSESKKEDEEINDAIEEILSATNTSMSSTLRSTSTLKSGSNTLTEGDRNVLLKLNSHSKESPFHATKKSQEEDDDDASTLVGENSGDSREVFNMDTNPNLLKVMHVEKFDLGAKVKAMIEAGADETKIKAMMKADEDVNQQEAKQIVKVMNSFRHMELHAGHSQNPKEPLVRSESHRVGKVGATQDRVPLVRPSSAGAARTRGRFHELKKATAGGSNQNLTDKTKGETEEGAGEVYVGVHGGYEAVVEALAGDVAKDVLENTAASETMCSRLSRHSSRAGSACTHDSQEEETIQWKKGNVLGKGAFGTVWCGLTNEGELIAVKQIELTTTDRQKAEREYEKVQEEVELLKTLNHTNIVGYLGTSLEESIVSIFMQFVPGGSIASILARFGALDETVFRRYTRQILQGVEYLHDNDVIHRDIKGGNVMLMPNGIIKLIDFGCAKRLCINLSLSQSQILRSMKGTPYWMAPEVVNESGHGKKSDIWSIGCTVFEMATRKPPWAEMNPMAAIFAIGSDRTEPPRLPEKFSPDAIAFVNRCLTRDQQQRPSATELLKDVFMAGQQSKK